MPTKETLSIEQEIRKDEDYIRSCLTKLNEYDDDFKKNCECNEKGQFVKYGFDFRKPLTVWDKKKLYKDYTVRL